MTLTETTRMVSQDGRFFFDEDTFEEIAAYPWYVADMDIEGAKQARAWFLAKAEKLGWKVEFVS